MEDTATTPQITETKDDWLALPGVHIRLRHHLKTGLGGCGPKGLILDLYGDQEWA